MKFFNLFKKELKEIITFQTLMGLFVGVAIFMLLGNVMKDVGKDMQSKMGSAVVYDKDQSDLSKECIEFLKQNNLEVHLIEGNTPKELTDKAFKYDEHTCVAVIPKGFEEGIKNGKVQELEVVSVLKSFSVMGNRDDSASTVSNLITNNISASILKENIKNADVEFIKAPIKTADTTVVGDKFTSANASMLSAFAMQQSMFIPIIVFILITFAAQLNSASIANEKNDKTLETLLSAPVSRLSVLGAKMCASGVFSLIMALVYMVGFSSYMGGMMGGMGASTDALADSGIGSALTDLGLNMGGVEYLLLGIQLFLTILIALAISMILGALAKDVKSAQTLTMPLMMFAMIPYFITMFTDVNSLPTIGKVLVYLIPFTHTFTASSNILFDNMPLFFIGMVYQIIVLAIVLFLAVRIFSTDKIFTMTLELKKKKKNI